MIKYLIYNYSTFRYSCRGCGSKKNLNEMKLDLWIEDLDHVINYFLLQNNNIEHLYLIGFSLGASIIIANKYFLKKEVDKKFNNIIEKIVLLSPVFFPDKDMFNRYIMDGSYAQAKYGNLIKNGISITTDMIDGLNINLNVEINNIDCNVLVIHSEDDQRIPIESSEKGYSMLNTKNKTFIKINKLGHSFRIGEDISQRNIIYEYISTFLRFF